jgi:hypothetical protein
VTTVGIETARRGSEGEKRDRWSEEGEVVARRRWRVEGG